MLLPQGREFLINPEAGFCDDLDHVLQILGRVELDLLLFGPPHVMRPEQPIDPCGKLDARAWIRSKKLFAYRYVQHATQYAKLLMNRRGLQQILFNDPLPGFDLYTLLEPLAEIRLYVVGAQIRESRLPEYSCKMRHRTLIHFVDLRCAKRRHGKVLQIRIRPFSECDLLPSAHRGKSVVVPSLQALSEDSLRFIPILSSGRLSLALPGFVPVLHPPDRRFSSLKQAAIMLYRSCHIPP